MRYALGALFALLLMQNFSPINQTCPTEVILGDGSCGGAPGGEGSSAWGGITGTLSDQTDLQSALDAKEASGTFSGTGACAANSWASTLNDGSAPTCTQPGFSNLSGSATDGQVPDTISLTNITQITNRAISDTTGTLAVARGGTNLTSSADDNVMVGNGTTWETKVIGDCDADNTVLHYDTTTNTFSCGDDDTGAGGGDTYVVMSGDVTNATTSYANVTGMSWAVSASTRYDIECHFQYNANATTTGIGIGWTGPASPTFTTGRMVSGLTTATIGGTTVAGNDTGGVTTASVATTANHADFHGTWANGANAGTLQMRFKSEVAVANAIVLKAGSWCKYSTY